MKHLKFVKMSGAGNDFIFFDDKDSIHDRQKLSKKLCERHHSVGADGVAFFSKVDSSRIRWDFYNADGSVGEMCGNAARCAGIYAMKHMGCEKIITLETLVGDVQINVEANDRVKVSMPKALWVVKNPERSIIDTGVPHLVLKRKLDAQALLMEASDLRFPSELGESGANVTFVDLVKGKIQALSYERGVEGFTQACGTGAVAAALFVREFADQFSGKYSDLFTDKSSNEMSIEMPGGILSVVAESQSPVLIGQAAEVFSGVVEEEV